jgi:hypothetical protein
MADFDPKEFVTRNPALVGAYVAALLPIPLWFVLVGGGPKADFETQANRVKGQGRNLNELESRLNDPQNPVYTERHVQELKDLRGKYEQNINALREVINSRTGVLTDRWFESDAYPKPAPGEAPRWNNFVDEWDHQCDLLVEEHRAMVTDPVSQNLYVYTEPPSQSPQTAMITGQKRFWVQAACLAALKTAGGERIQLISPGIDFPTPAPANFVAQPQSPDGEEGSAPREPPYALIPINLPIRCQLSDLPTIVGELLRQEVVMRVVKVEVSKAQFYWENPEYSFDVSGTERVFFDTAYGADVKEPTTELAELPGLDGESRILEPLVDVILRLEAYDFKRVKVPSAEDGQ